MKKLKLYITSCLCRCASNTVHKKKIREKYTLYHKEIMISVMHPQFCEIKPFPASVLCFSLLFGLFVFAGTPCISADMEFNDASVNVITPVFSA